MYLFRNLCSAWFAIESVMNTRTTSEQALYRLLRLFQKSERAHAAAPPSKSNPLRWASLWFLGEDGMKSVMNTGTMKKSTRGGAFFNIMFRSAKREAALCVLNFSSQVLCIFIHPDRTSRAGCSTTPGVHGRKREYAPAGPIQDTVCAA